MPPSRSRANVFARQCETAASPGRTAARSRSPSPRRIFRNVISAAGEESIEFRPRFELHGLRNEVERGRFKDGAAGFVLRVGSRQIPQFHEGPKTLDRKGLR